MAGTVAEVDASPAARGGLPVIDCDIHQGLADPTNTLFEYLSDGWKDYARGSAGYMVPVDSGSRPFAANPFGYIRDEAFTEDGTPPASSPAEVIEHHFEPNNVVAGLLTGEMPLYMAGISNPYWAAEVARANNDYLSDVWLSADSRFKGSIALSMQVPEWAADEIRRVADRPGFVQLGLATNPQSYGFGHPIYDPVHRACAETGMAIGIHALGEGSGGATMSHTASGFPTMYIEYHVGAPQGMMTHLMSFIVHGVFEKYPSLKLLLMEPGMGWLPPFMAHLDAKYKGLRREIPWVRKAPSEYLHDHVLLTTQPFDADGPDDDVIRALDRLGAEDFIVYSSDYPHWDGDEPMAVLTRVPRSWRNKIAYENASAALGIEVPAAAGSR